MAVKEHIPSNYRYNIQSNTLEITPNEGVIILKTVKSLSFITFILIVFAGGYFTGKVNSKEVSREIRIGYENIQHAGQIDFKKVFTDLENQNVIDNLMMIYLYKKETLTPPANPDKPDIYLSVLSPKQSTGLIDSKLWFTKEGAIIGVRSGVDWDEPNYFEINNDYANYLKEQIDYEE